MAGKFHLFARFLRLVVWNWNSAIDTGFSFDSVAGREILRVVELFHLS